MCDMIFCIRINTRANLALTSFVVNTVEQLREQQPQPLPQQQQQQHETNSQKRVLNYDTTKRLRVEIF